MEDIGKHLTELVHLKEEAGQIEEDIEAAKKKHPIDNDELAHLEQLQYKNTNQTLIELNKIGQIANSPKM